VAENGAALEAWHGLERAFRSRVKPILPSWPLEFRCQLKLPYATCLSTPCRSSRWPMIWCTPRDCPRLARHCSERRFKAGLLDRACTPEGIRETMTTHRVIFESICVYLLHRRQLLLDVPGLTPHVRFHRILFPCRLGIVRMKPWPLSHTGEHHRIPA
jgi:hypothetical protein